MNRLWDLTKVSFFVIIKVYKVGGDSEKKYKYLAFLLFIFLSVGFAILSSNLQMGTNISIANASFDVHFEDAEVYKTNINDFNNSPVINEKKDTVSIDLDLEKPGDYVNVRLLVVNSGTIDGMLNKIVATTLTS